MPIGIPAYVKILGYCMSIPIDTFDRFANLSIDAYCLTQNVQRNWYNRVFVVLKKCVNPAIDTYFFDQ